MKAGISSYSFSQALNAGCITLQELPKKAAEMGFCAMDFVDTHLISEGNPKDNAKLLRDKCGEAGMEIVNLAAGANFFCTGDYKDEVQRLKDMVDIAEALGTHCMRHDLTSTLPKGFRTFHEVLPILAAGAREVSLYAADKGIRTTSENHGFFMQDSLRMEQFVSQVKCENYGLLLDIGNFLCADEDPTVAISRLAPLAFLVHVKDFFIKTGREAAEMQGQGWFYSRGGNALRGTVLGHGDVPIAQCLRILKAAGYDGAVVLEFEGVEDNLTALQWSADNLLRMLSVL